MRTRNALTIVLAIAATVLAFNVTPAMGDAEWTGFGATDNWSDMDNWKIADHSAWQIGDPTLGGSISFPNSSWTSTVDGDTSGWNIADLRPRGNGTLTIPTDGTLKTTHEIGMGNPGNPTISVTGGDLISSVVWRFGLLEFSGGSWTGGRCYAGPEIHVIGTGASSLSPTRFACGAPLNRVHFTLEADGVTPFTPTSSDPFDGPQHTGTGLKVDGIQDYIDEGKLAGDIIPLFTFGAGVTDSHIIDIFPVSKFDYDDTLATLTVDEDGARLTILPPPEMQWDGGTGNWADAKWSSGQAPTANKEMIIDAATNDSVVTVAADFMTGGTGPAGSVDIGANNTASLTVNGGVTLDVSGGVDIGGSGTMLVNGALTTTGVTVASGGTLGGSGTIGGAVTVETGGTVAPGASIGTLGVTGNVAVGGTYAAEVSGSGAPVAGTNNDSLAVTGDVTVGAMGVDLTWLVGAKIGADGDGKFGGEYTIVTGGTVTGAPADVTINSFVAKFPDGHTVDLWESYYHDVTGPGDVLVTVGPADPFTDKVTVNLPQVLRGDSTLDGRVMMNDALPIILNWQKAVPAGTGWELGNFNFDDKIMMNDALEIILSWGQKTDADPPGPNPAGAVVAAVEDRATAYYDAATGFVWLEVNSALAYLQIIDPNSSGELGPKDPDGTKPFVGFHPLMAAALLEDERPHHVGEMNFGGLPQTAGPHLYVEATPGIPQEDFDFVLYTAALDWTDATVDVVWTPEPATMTLLLMGGALVLARRRRRK